MKGLSTISKGLTYAEQQNELPEMKTQELAMHSGFAGCSAQAGQGITTLREGPSLQTLHFKHNLPAGKSEMDFQQYTPAQNRQDEDGQAQGS